MYKDYNDKDNVWSRDRLIFIMIVPALVGRHIYSEFTPDLAG